MYRHFSFTKFSLIFFSLFISSIILAQPNDHQIKYGCRYFKNKLSDHHHHNHDHQHKTVTANNERSDTIDIINYEINLDVTNFTLRRIKGDCVVSFKSKLDNINQIILDLRSLDVTSVLHNGNPLSFTHDGFSLVIDLPNTLNTGDEDAVRVLYEGAPIEDPSGFGGFTFEEGYAYNLGIGLTSTPHNFGSGWFPCFDNFVERATYDLNILSSEGRKGYGIGEFLGEETVGMDSVIRRYRMNDLLPTYLVGVAVSEYEEITDMHDAVSGQIPLQYVAKAQDTAAAKTAFQYVGDAVDAFEFWFGPYQWDKVGYVLTSNGAMEHATLIAYPDGTVRNGNQFANNRLMAHELAHHWWGDYMTVRQASDMWVKEGTAEYSAHLFVEYAFGRAEFTDFVKDNHLDVIRGAHIEDGAYLAISGVGPENTYGMHTYNKGASMIHNLRGYLGDSLFRVASQSLLNAYAYDAADAIQFRDQMMAATGYDLNPFFDAWIFAPGYTSFEFESVESVPNGSNYDVTVMIQQKLHEAPSYHTQVPMDITFMDANRNKHVEQVMLSGEFTTLNLTIPFDPVIQFLDETNKINNAKQDYQAEFTEDGGETIPYVGFDGQMDILSISDTAFFRAEHYWVAPDPIINPAARISDSHYWKFDILTQGSFHGKAVLPYEGSQPFQLDHNLVSTTEDSLILVFRENPSQDWGEYPPQHYRKLTFGSGDGSGIIRIDSIMAGEYAFANGMIPIFTNTAEPNQLVDFKVFPNPARSVINIETELSNSTEINITLFDIQGKRLLNEYVQSPSLRFNHQLQVGNLAAGIYVLKLTDEYGNLLRSEKIDIIK